MKYHKLIHIVILLSATAIFLWAVPSLVRLASSTVERYPFVYYSEIIKQFTYRETLDKQSIRRDAQGRRYEQAQFDSIMPSMYYRQLSVEGKMPDTICGQAVTMRDLRVNSFSYRFTPKEVNSPQLKLYVMFESMPKRLNLELPGDAFRMKDNIEFIDIETGSVNRAKSDLWQSELEKRGFQFPAQWLQGIITTKKAYDEGYFTKDAAGDLFHIKMVNGRPFVRDTKVGDTIAVRHFSMLQMSNKRFYGFVFDYAGYIYLLETQTCRLQKLDIAPVNIDRDEVIIIGNMFYWTVTVQTPEGRHYYALDNNTLAQVDLDFIPAPNNRWTKLSAWLFPAWLTFESDTSGYFGPQLHFTAWTALTANLLIALLFTAVSLIRRRRCIWPYAGFIIVTGIAGWLAVLISDK